MAKAKFKYDPVEQSKAQNFHKKMTVYVDEYREHILHQGTAVDPTNSYGVTQEFFNYLWGYHLITEFDQITVSMVNSKFHAFFKVHYKEDVPKSVVKAILKDFFTFLYGKYGITNEKITKALNK